MKAFSLFSGIGGFDLALKRNGVEIVGACEIDKYARSVYGKHFPGVKIWENATTINPKEIPDHDIFCAGFPCQAFSIAGKRRGFNDTRGTLFFEIQRIVKEKQPSILLLENVLGLLSHDKGQTFATILDTLDALRFDVEWQVLNSKNFGVAQNRERVFIVGHSRGKRTRKIFPLGGDYTKMDESQKETVVLVYTSQVNQNMKQRVQNRTNTWTLGTTPQRDFMIIDPKTGRGRRPTPLECERLQGFPDNWTEGHADTQRYKMCGNAVTVPVVEYLVQELLR